MGGTASARHSSERGSAMAAVLVLVMIASIVGVTMMSKATFRQTLAGLRFSRANVEEKVEGDLAVAKMALVQRVRQRVESAGGIAAGDESNFFNGLTLPVGQIELSFPPSFDGAANPQVSGPNTTYGYPYTLSVGRKSTRARYALSSQGAIQISVNGAGPPSPSFGDYYLFVGGMTPPPRGSIFDIAHPDPGVSGVNVLIPYFVAFRDRLLVTEGKIHSNGEPITNAVTDASLHGRPSRISFWTITSSGGTFDPVTEGTWFTGELTSVNDLYTHKKDGGMAFDPTITGIPACATPPNCWLPDWLGSTPSQVKLEDGFHVHPAISLPGNVVPQETSALTGTASETAPTNMDRRRALGLSVNSDPLPDGVYLPNNGANVTGGIYVQGCVADLHLEKAGADQVYRVQTCGGTNSEIRINYALGTTSIGGTSYAGVPAGSLFVQGELRKLNGPHAAPALHERTEVTISSTVGDIIINDSLTYAEDPRFVGGAENILGVIAGGGGVATCDFDDPSCADGGTYEFHGKFMGLNGPGGAMAFRDRGAEAASPSFTCGILGSRIGKYYQGLGSYTSTGSQRGCTTILYSESDPRDGLNPPFFPTAGSGGGGPAVVSVTLHEAGVGMVETPEGSYAAAAF